MPKSEFKQPNANSSGPKFIKKNHAQPKHEISINDWYRYFNIYWQNKWLFQVV